MSGIKPVVQVPIWNGKVSDKIQILLGKIESLSSIHTENILSSWTKQLFLYTKYLFPFPNLSSPCVINRWAPELICHKMYILKGYRTGKKNLGGRAVSQLCAGWRIIERQTWKYNITKGTRQIYDCYVVSKRDYPILYRRWEQCNFAQLLQPPLPVRLPVRGESIVQIRSLNSMSPSWLQFAWSCWFQ